MMDLLRLCLEPVFQRRRSLGRLLRVASGIAACAGLNAVLNWAGYGGGWASLGIVCWGLLVLVVLDLRQPGPDYPRIARQVEERHPQLHALLRTAVEQRPDPETGQLGYLQGRVVSEAVAACRRLNLAGVVPGWKLGGARLLVVGMLGIFVWTVWSVPPTRVVPGAASVAVRSEEPVVIEPGDVEVEKGTDVVVVARFPEPGPALARLVAHAVDGKLEELALTRSLGDPVYGGSLRAVQQETVYRVEFDGNTTREFRVQVFEYPRLERSDLKLQYPEYTGLPEKEVPDSRRLSAVEGTRVECRLQLNKPVRRAVLVAKDGRELVLEVDPAAPSAVLSGFKLEASATYELRLEDAEGRAAKLPEKFVFEALKNRVPDLRVEAPHGDQRFSQIEEVTFRGRVSDDFGVVRYGLVLRLPGGRQEEVVLGAQGAPGKPQSFRHALHLEGLGLEPDELLSWNLWAEDRGVDGGVRRTESELYFGEIRPFEEVFRKVPESEAGEGEPQGNKVRKLIDSQRKVLNATWNLRRTTEALPSEARPGPGYGRDEAVLREGQELVLGETRELEQSVEDAKSRKLAGEAVQRMEGALEQLRRAEKDPAPLEEAVRAESDAHAALLKLVAHEYGMSRSRGQAGRSQEEDPARRQMDELEMKPEAERYEKQKETASADNEARREQLAVLNRLKELAQRQNDINRQLQELQPALQMAKDEAEREEIRRRLKRLREEEQQLLADLDELRQKMDASKQAAQMQDSRQQLDRTRADAQQAAAALEQQQAASALASGKRAEKRLEELRDDLRKQAGGQFREEMRELRRETRELAERQKEIGEQLAGENRPPKADGAKAGPRRLSSETAGKEDKEAPDRALAGQQKRFEGVTSRIKDLSEQSEQAEPLLSRQLEETLRETVLAGTGDKLEQAAELSRRGLERQARGYGEQARTEIEELRKGVEKAAQSVLGDEAESLRAARAELLAASKSLDLELAEPGQQPGQQPGQSLLAGAGSQRHSEGPAGWGGRWGGAMEGENAGPLTGDRFAEWADRLRNVEEMLDDPALRAEAARIRETARGMRGEFKKAGKLPKRDLVNSQIGVPLAELRQRVEEELARKESRENLVPIDRDPVPAKYVERVRRYYEELGKP